MLDDLTLSLRTEAAHGTLRTLDFADAISGSIESQLLPRTDYGEWLQILQCEDTPSIFVKDSPPLTSQLFVAEGSVTGDSGSHLEGQGIPWQFEDFTHQASDSQERYSQTIYSQFCIAPSSPEPQPAPWTLGVIACGLPILVITYLLLRPQGRSTLSIICLAYLYLMVFPLIACVYLIELSKKTS